MALRSLSAIFGVLLVWVIADLGRRLFSPTTGLAAGFIAALSPFQVYYSQEARMYILLALETAFAMLLFWYYLKANDNDKKQQLHLVISGLLLFTWIAGLYTHYFFPVIIALQHSCCWSGCGWIGQPVIAGGGYCNGSRWLDWPDWRFCRGRCPPIARSRRGRPHPTGPTSSPASPPSSLS